LSKRTLPANNEELDVLKHASSFAVGLCVQVEATAETLAIYVTMRLLTTAN